MSVNIKYKNNSIATLTDTGTKTLKTSSKYCEADIIVENTKDAGGGGYAVEAHVVRFAADLTCAYGSSVELCDTAIRNPLAFGMVTYSDGTTGNQNAPVLAFGIGNALSGATPTSGYACGTSDSGYSNTSRGYVMLYSNASGAFNTLFKNGLFVENGKLKWNNKAGLGLSSVSAKFPAGATYIFFILGANE